MANAKTPEDTGAEVEWSRTGGAVGDTSMADQAAFNAGGAGVTESIKEAPQDGSDPNEDAPALPQQAGAEQ